MTERYRISDRNLALRKEFIRFTDADVRILAKLADWGKEQAELIAKEFYDHQFTFGPTVAYFESQARRRGVSMADLRQHLERAQAGYLRAIFQEAKESAQFGARYFASRLHVGNVHNRINLPIKWFLGAYVSYFDLVRAHLQKSFPLRPLFRAKAERALLAVFNYDAQAVIDAFFYDYLESIGLDLSQISVTTPDNDLSEHYADLKTVVRGTLSETIETTRVLETAIKQLVGEVDQINQAIAAISSACENVEHTTQTLGNRVDVTSQDLAEMAASIMQVAQNAETLSAAVSETSTAIEEMAASVQQVARTVEDANQVSEHSADVAEEGREAVEMTIAGMAQINGAMSDVVSVIQGLGKSSEEIGAIIEVIDEIAEQTNLLALNAAIEAARAGEHGRGFAVVADEVRKLAERSAKATGEIAQLIKGIQKETEAAVASTQQGAIAIEKGTALAQKAGKSLHDIVTSVKQVSTMMAEIRQATQEQSRAAAQIASAVTSMNQLTQSVMDATQAQSRGAEQVVSTVSRVQEITQSVADATRKQREASQRAAMALGSIRKLTKEVDRKSQDLGEAVAYFSLSREASALPVPVAAPEPTRV